MSNSIWSNEGVVPLQPLPDASDSLITRSSPCTWNIGRDFPLLFPTTYKTTARKTPSKLLCYQLIYTSIGEMLLCQHRLFGQILSRVSPMRLVGKRTRECPADRGYSSSALQSLEIYQPLCIIWYTSVESVRWSRRGKFSAVGGYTDHG